MVNMGRILKEARLKKEMTLQDVSGKCGYSKALISRIENNSVSPSLESLTKIAEALNVGVAEIFAFIESDEPLILKKEKRNKLALVKGRYEIELLTNGSAVRMMRPMLFSLENGAEASGRNIREGDKFLHVLSGKAEVIVGERAYVLKTGDSIYFKSMIPHKFRGVAKGKTVSLTVTYLP